MRNAVAAEWLLRLVITSGRAASTVGDLLEEACERGTLWFWASVLQTASSHVCKDLRVSWRRMMWLAFSGLLETWILCAALGFTAIPLLQAILPYQIDSHSIYIPPWSFHALLTSFVTLVPLLVGWDVARRSHGHEIAAGVALTSVFGGISAFGAIRSGVLVRHFETPYPYEQNVVTMFCTSALCVMAGAMLCRLLANAKGRSAPSPMPPEWKR